MDINSQTHRGVPNIIHPSDLVLFLNNILVGWFYYNRSISIINTSRIEFKGIKWTIYSKDFDSNWYFLRRCSEVSDSLSGALESVWCECVTNGFYPPSSGWLAGGLLLILLPFFLHCQPNKWLSRHKQWQRYILNNIYFQWTLHNGAVAHQVVGYK